jgi:hypothetical protein
VVPIESNQAIAAELTRITAPGSRAAACCPEPACANHGVPLPAGRYKRFGYTRHGSPRIRCLADGCGRTFTLQRAIRRQRKPHENKTVFKALVSKAPVRSIAFQADLSPQAVYDKIDFIHRQCLAFAAAYERRLPESTRDRLWIQVDRQDHIVNWTDRRDKRNVQLTAIASADQASGFVFSCDLNFDPLSDRTVIEAEATAAGDCDGRGYAFRRHARFWLAQDLVEAILRGDADAGRVERARRKARRRYAHDPLLGPIERHLLEAFAVTDPEAGEEPSRHRRLPEHGMQVPLGIHDVHPLRAAAPGPARDRQDPLLPRRRQRHAQRLYRDLRAGDPRAPSRRLRCARAQGHDRRFSPQGGALRPRADRDHHG